MKSLLVAYILIFYHVASGEENEIPSRRFGHTTVVTSGNTKLIMYGGYSGTPGYVWRDSFSTWDYSGGLLNKDLYEYEIATKKWKQIIKQPGAAWPPYRAFHSASVVGNKMIIFGGTTIMWGNHRRGGTSLMKLCGEAGMWEYEIDTQKWTQLQENDIKSCEGEPGSAHAEL